MDPLGLSKTSPSLLSRAQVSSPFSSTQGQVDLLVENFTEQSSDWKSLAAMMVGGLAYRWGKIGVMSLHVGVYCNTPLRMASVAIGLGTEVTAFELTNRFLHTLWTTGQSPLQSNHPTLWTWSGPGGLKEGLLSSLVNFGTLKGFGKMAETQNLILQHGLQDFGMLTGHQLAYQTGLGEKPEGSIGEQMVHAESTNLQMGAGLDLGHSLTGGKILAMERGLDISLRKGPHLDSVFPFFAKMESSQAPSLAGSFAGKEPFNPSHILAMSRPDDEQPTPPGPRTFIGEEKRKITRIFERSSIVERLPAVLEALEKTGWDSKLKYKVLLRLADRAKMDFVKALELLEWILPSEGRVVHFHVRDSAFYREFGKKHGEWPSKIPEFLKEAKSKETDYLSQAKILLNLTQASDRNFNAFHNLPILLEGMDRAGWTFEQQSHLLLLLAQKKVLRTPLVKAEETTEASPPPQSWTPATPSLDEFDTFMEEPLPFSQGKKPSLEELENRSPSEEEDPAELFHLYEQEKTIEAILRSGPKPPPAENPRPSSEAFVRVVLMNQDFPRGGFIFRIDSEEKTPTVGEVWEVGDLQGDVLTLVSGKKMGQDGLVSDLQGDRQFRFSLSEGESFPFKKGERLSLLWEIRGGSGRDDDHKPTKPFRPISPEDKKFVHEFYQKYPKLKEALEESGWTQEEKKDFLDVFRIVAPFLEQALAHLPETLLALQRAGFSYKHQSLLLPYLADKAGTQVSWAFAALSPALEWMRVPGWGEEQQYQLLHFLAEKAAPHIDQAYENLPSALQALELTDWSSAKKLQFLHVLIERSGHMAGSTFQGMRSTFLELKELGWGFHSHYPFLQFLVDNSGHRIPFVGDASIRYSAHFNPLKRASRPPIDIQARSDFYPVRSLDTREPSEGMIVPLRSAQYYPPDIEVWEVKYAEGDRLILSGGKRSLKNDSLVDLEGQRVVQNIQRVYFPFREGNKVIFWPRTQTGEGSPSWWKKLIGVLFPGFEGDPHDGSFSSFFEQGPTPAWAIKPFVTDAQVKMAGGILSKKKSRIHPVFLEGLSYFLSEPPREGDEGLPPPEPKSEEGAKKEGDDPYRSSGLPKVHQALLERLVKLIEENPSDLHGTIWAFQEMIRKSQIRNPINFSSLLGAIHSSKASPSIKAVMAAKAAVAFQVQGLQEFKNTLKAIWESGAEAESEVVALFELARNPHFRDKDSLSSLAAALFASNANPSLIVKMLGELGAKASFEDPEFYRKIMSQIRESLGPAGETIQSIGRVAGNPHFHELQSVLQEIYNFEANPEHKTIALYHLSQNSSLVDLDDLKGVIKAFPRGAPAYYSQPILQKIIQNPAFEIAYQRQILAKLIQNSRLDSETKDYGIDLLNRRTPTRPGNEFYEVASLGASSLNGFLVPLKSELPNVGEIWRVASLEGDRITLHHGKKIIRPGIFRAIFWKRILKIHPGKNGTISLKVGDPVAFLPEVKGGSGDPPQPSPSIKSLAKRARYDREAVRQLFALYRDNHPSAGKALRDLDCRGYLDQADTDAEAVEILFYCRLAGNLLAEAKLRKLNVDHFSKAAYFDPASAFALERLSEAQNPAASPILKTLDVFEHARLALAGNFLSAQVLYLCAKAGNASARQALMRAAPRNPEAADFLQQLELPPGKPPSEIAYPGHLQEGGVAFLFPLGPEDPSTHPQSRMKIIHHDPQERILTLESWRSSEKKAPLLFHFYYSLEHPLPFRVGDEVYLLRGVGQGQK